MNINDHMKALAVIRDGANSTMIKSRLLLEQSEIEVIIESLQNDGLVDVTYKNGLFGKKTTIQLTTTGEHKLAEFTGTLNDSWKKMIQIIAEQGRESLDQFLLNQPNLVGLLLFFGIVALPTLSRLNLVYLLEKKQPCYLCKKELAVKFMQKFTIEDCKKFDFVTPHGMMNNDVLCSVCFDKLSETNR